MSARLAGKVALITGAGGDIGRAISLAFAEAGAAVVCADIDAAAAQMTVTLAVGRGGRAISIKGDISRSEEARAAVDAAVEWFGRLHILVNNAAFFMPDATVADVDEALWERTFAVNVGGAFRMSRFAVPRIAEAGGGAIIHIASQMGHVARPRQAAYCSSKAALIVLAKAMALDHAAERIRVNTLSPGGIATQGMADQWGGMDVAEREWGARMHPIGRLGRVEEIAQAALFLASDEASFVTGTDLLVDGGYCAQ